MTYEFSVFLCFKFLRFFKNFLVRTFLTLARSNFSKNRPKNSTIGPFLENVDKKCVFSARAPLLVDQFDVIKLYRSGIPWKNLIWQPESRGGGVECGGYSWHTAECLFAWLFHNHFFKSLPAVLKHWAKQRLFSALAELGKSIWST